MIKLLILFFLFSCGNPKTINKIIETEPDIVEIDKISFDVYENVETNLENDLFIIPGIYQNDNIQFQIVLNNKTLNNKNINISLSDSNFSFTHNCSILRSRSKCSIIIKNNIKNIGLYNSEIVINGKSIGFSMSISPSIINSNNQLTFNTSELIVDSKKALILKNNNLSSIPLDIQLGSSEDSFNIQNNCQEDLNARKSCNLNISLSSGSENGVTRQISINGQVIVLIVLKNNVIESPDLSISLLDENVNINDIGKLRIKITNSKLSPQAVNLSLLNQGTTNCPSVLTSRRSCSYDYNIVTDSLKEGSQNLNLNILGKNIVASVNINKSKCSSSERASASECDPNANNDFMAQNIIDTQIYPNAICNDGSPASFFRRSGVGSGAKRWIIHLEEGGFCGEFPLSFPSFVTYFNVCPMRRQQTPLYVSTNLDPTGYRYNSGILNGLEENNPDFYSWNHVEVRYCSSDIWSGDNSQIIANEPFQWQFRGLNILDAVFTTLQNQHGLNDATNVILSGSSAGGFGILAQGDYLKETFLSTKDVVLLSDSSWVQSFNNLNGHNFFDLLFERNISYLNGRPDATCSSRLGINNYRCFLGIEAYSDLSTPSFVIQDQLDEFYLNIAYGISSVCSANSAQKSLMTNLANQLRSEFSTNVGMVSPRSFNHVFLTSSRWKDPSILDGQISIQEIFSNWYFNKNGAKQFISAPSNIDSEIFNFCN